MQVYYYTRNSLKAKLCVEGNGYFMIIAKNMKCHIRNCGKLIVDNFGEGSRRDEGIRQTAIGNGVNDLCDVW